jgi:hypothetical protein
VAGPRRPRARLAAALSAALALLAAVLSACSGSGSAADPPTLADVRALLARHGAAVVHHDRSAFLADVDSDSAATTFRAAQQEQFANLAKLPVARWSYAVDSRTDDRSAEQAAARRFGGPTLIAQITLSYMLRGIDAAADTHQLWWTFVRRNGRVVAAADDGLAAVGGQSWQGPWDFGPLDVVTGHSGVVIGHADSASELPGIAAEVDAAVPAVTAVWGSGWRRQVLVVVPSSPDELSALAGEASTIGADVAAAAVGDGADPMTGAPTGERLIVNPDALRRLSATGRAIVLRHEITHIATAAATSDATPRWLVEGFADYVGNLGSGQSVPVAAAELHAAARAGHLPVALPSAADFDDATSAAEAYEGAWLACRLIAARAGQEGLVRFYRLVGQQSTSSDAALTVALRAVLHETPARFTAQWRGYLRDLLG